MCIHTMGPAAGKGDPSGGDVYVCIFVSIIRYSTFLLQIALRPWATFAPIHQPDELCPFNIADSTTPPPPKWTQTIYLFVDQDTNQ